MKSYVYTPKEPQEHEFFAQWMAQRIPNMGTGGVQCLAVYVDDKLAACVGYSRTHFNRIELTWASDNPRHVTKGNILILLGLPFQTMNMEAVTAFARKKDKRQRKIYEWLGFKHEGTIRRADVDFSNIMVYGFLRQDYENLVERWKGNDVITRFNELYPRRQRRA